MDEEFDADHQVLHLHLDVLVQGYIGFLSLSSEKRDVGLLHITMLIHMFYFHFCL
jgi:hypothetical protein